MMPGAPAADAPVAGPDGPWLLAHLCNGFTLLAFGGPIAPEAVEALGSATIPCRVMAVAPGPSACAGAIVDREGLAAKRYDAKEGTVVLLRPDQHVCARWRRFDLERVRAAIARATANA